jgi:hypothetical protein
MHLIAAASDYINIEASRRALQAGSGLQEMITCHSFARRARHFLRKQAQNWSAAVLLMDGRASVEEARNLWKPSMASIRNSFIDDSIFFRISNRDTAPAVEGELERNGFELI